ncbi:MAG: cell division protein FtsA, partial [Pricia sp.]
DIASPLYATAVGLLMNAVSNGEKAKAAEVEKKQEEELVMAGHEEDETIAGSSKPTKERQSVFDKWSEKLKDFLDNAE